MSWHKKFCQRKIFSTSFSEMDLLWLWLVPPTALLLSSFSFRTIQQAFLQSASQLETFCIPCSLVKLLMKISISGRHRCIFFPSERNRWSPKHGSLINVHWKITSVKRNVTVWQKPCFMLKAERWDMKYVGALM